MLGAIVGDIVGSTREGSMEKLKGFHLFAAGSRFTDDTVMTCAIAKAILEGKDYGEAMRELGAAFPDSGYGGHFRRWILGQIEGPYGSFGNGSAMRASPVGWAFESEDEVLREARASALPTHDHPEGVKGAQATALAVWLARKGASKPEIRKEIEARFGYDLRRRLRDIRPAYVFDVSCQGTVPEALISFLESFSFEDAIRNAVSLGGDADTLAAIAGPVAEAYYGRIGDKILGQALGMLDNALYDIVDGFIGRFRPEDSSRLKTLRRDSLAMKRPQGAGDRAGGDAPAELLDLDEEERQEGWEATRADMLESSSWYEAWGWFKGQPTHDASPSFVKIEGRKLLALGRSDFYLSFIEALARESGERFYQSDFMAWLEPGDPYESLMYFIATADRIDFSLEGIGLEELRLATSGSGGRKRSRRELGSRYMSSWEANQIYWGDELEKTWWHLRGGLTLEETAGALGGRVPRGRIVEEGRP
jgi:ADP-ribosylglycohydrolase